MSKRISSRVVGMMCVAALGIGAAATTAGAGVVAVSRETRILAAVFTDEQAQARIESAEGVTDLAPFDDSVARSFNYNPDDPFDGGAEAHASQASALTIVNGELAGARIAGEAGGVNVADAAGLFELVFDVAGDPVAFLFSPVVLAGGEGGTPGNSRLTLTDVTRNIVIRDAQSGNSGFEEPPDPFDPDGVLSPGRYALRLEYGVRNNFGVGRADVGLALAAVPLPPAVWPGLVGLACCIGWSQLRRRSRA